MQHVRRHAGRVPSVGPGLQKDRKKSLRRMLLQMRAPCCMVRDLAMRLYDSGAEANGNAQADPRQRTSRDSKSIRSTPKAKTGVCDTAGKESSSEEKEVNNVKTWNQMSAMRNTDRSIVLR